MYVCIYILVVYYVTDLYIIIFKHHNILRGRLLLKQCFQDSCVLHYCTRYNKNAGFLTPRPCIIANQSNPVPCCILCAFPIWSLIPLNSTKNCPEFWRTPTRQACLAPVRQRPQNCGFHGMWPERS